MLIASLCVCILSLNGYTISHMKYLTKGTSNQSTDSSAECLIVFDLYNDVYLLFVIKKYIF